MQTHHRSDALQALHGAAWLQGYPESLARSLLAEGRLVRLDAGQWAQAEGDDRPGFAVVISGLLHSYCAAPGDREVLVGLAGPGSVIGHATRYSGGPRLVTAVCAEDSVLLELSLEAIDRIAARTPQIWQAMAGFAYVHMRSTLRMAAEVIALRPRERIAARLLAFHDQIPPADGADAGPVIKVSQELLGEMTGLTRKTVNHHLAGFEAVGLIRVGYGKITLRDIAGLHRIADRAPSGSGR
jgi:CRP/FNR family transcriptional regulator, cyclic AMP receptor protein